MSAEVLPGTRLLTSSGDLAWEMVEGIAHWLEQETARLAARREADWPGDRTSPIAWRDSLAPYRSELAELLGVVDERAPCRFELCRTRSDLTLEDGRIAISEQVEVRAVRWPVLPGIDGEGLLVSPVTGPPVADLVWLTHCDQSPEAAVIGSLRPGQANATLLAAAGCRVLVPALIDRDHTWSGHPAVRQTRHPHREFLARPAFMLGRTTIGYELQRVLAGATALADESPSEPPRPLLLWGYGEGGQVALYAGALDDRFTAVAVSGYFGPREELWREPIDRNVWRRLIHFGDAELAAMIAPRRLLVETSPIPEFEVPATSPDSTGPTPGRLVTVDHQAASAELDRAERLVDGLTTSTPFTLVDGLTDGPSGEAATAWLLAQARATPPAQPTTLEQVGSIDGEARRQRTISQPLAHTQALLREAPFRRAEYWSDADDSSLAAWQASSAAYRQRLSRDVIGELPAASLPPDPRSRLRFADDQVTAYDVVLQVHPEVFAAGVLLLPADLPAGERRPVVVAQHGLEGTPDRVIAGREADNPPYRGFGYQLASRGFVVFAPQNPYRGGDHFRSLQRRANPLGLSLFSFIVRQHEVILDWLADQPFVAADRMGFYGISYGGKTAMRVPALLPRYALSICSADYGEWIWKNVSTRDRYSYVFTGEYEMSEWNLGHTFNYAEMSWLICPRPFMVERGHHDGVQPDEWVGYEFARTYRRYNLLGIGERAAIEWFDGPHAIWGEATFRFLHRWLDWPEPEER